MGKDLETKPMGFLISSILCPECQGTGIEVEDDKLKSLISLCLRCLDIKLKSVMVVEHG